MGDATSASGAGHTAARPAGSFSGSTAGRLVARARRGPARSSRSLAQAVESGVAFTSAEVAARPVTPHDFDAPVDATPARAVEGAAAAPPGAMPPQLEAIGPQGPGFDPAPALRFEAPLEPTTAAPGSGRRFNLVGAQPNAPQPSKQATPAGGPGERGEPAYDDRADSAERMHPPAIRDHPNPIGKQLESAAADRADRDVRYGTAPPSPHPTFVPERADDTPRTTIADLAPTQAHPKPAATTAAPPAAADPTAPSVAIGTIEIVTPPPVAPAAVPDPLAPLADRRRHGRRRIGPRDRSR